MLTYVTILEGLFVQCICRTFNTNLEFGNSCSQISYMLFQLETLNENRFGRSLMCVRLNAAEDAIYSAEFD
jgi:hypothetical protein